MLDRDWRDICVLLTYKSRYVKNATLNTYEETMTDYRISTPCNFCYNWKKHILSMLRKQVQIHGSLYY